MIEQEFKAALSKGDLLVAGEWLASSLDYDSNTSVEQTAVQILALWSSPEAVPYSSLANPQSLNLYGYVLNNPLSKTDADGHAPDILVIEDGPTQGNPIGHTAIAVTGRGVYSFGTNTPLGSSTTDFLQMESGRRNETVTVIKTTPEQDQAGITELTKQNANGSINLYPDNGASRTNAALDAAGVPQKTYSTPVAEVPAQDTSMPGTAGSRAQATPGSQTTVIPKNGPCLPTSISSIQSLTNHHHPSRKRRPTLLGCRHEVD